MKAQPRYIANIRLLLRSGEVDVRKACSKNKLLTVDEYFAAFELFMQKTPLLVSDLTHITNFGENSRFLEELGDMEKLSLEIGYDKLSEEIKDILRAIRDDDPILMSEYTAKLYTRLNRFNKNTLPAYKEKKQEKARAADSGEEEQSILLENAVEQILVEEEARKPRILAVDDVAMILNTIVSVLSPYYEVFGLTKGGQVKDFLRHTTPDLFLLDIEMPDMSGYDVVDIIRQFEEHKDTPIIFLTGNATVDNLKSALAQGASDFITKPVNNNILLEKIQSKIVKKNLF